MQTRSQTDRTELQQLTDTVASLSASFTEFRASQNARHEAYLTTLTDIHHRLNTPKPQPPPIAPPPMDQPLKPPKLHLQSFDGSAPLEWIFQANQYFAHYAIPPDQRLTYVYAFMSGDALGWYQ